jgi:hypothetical protein
MWDVGAGQRSASIEGVQTAGGGRLRGYRVAIAAAVSALFACAHGAPPGTAAAYTESVRAGLDLYEGGEYVIAARRFEDASREAQFLRDGPGEKRAVAAACTSWLRARRVGEFARCTDQLEHLHRRANRAEPGLAALLALGAIAGDRELPPFRVTPGAREVISETAALEEEER